MSEKQSEYSKPEHSKTEHSKTEQGTDDLNPIIMYNPFAQGRPKKKDVRDSKSRTGFPKRPQFTMEQINTAVEVMKYSRIVRNWVLSELKAYGIDPTSSKGQNFIIREMEKAARKTVE